MSTLGLDIGGAHLKAATSGGFAATRYFPLWQKPDQLERELAELIDAAPPSQRLAATMTGELADCFPTKADGVAWIIQALLRAARGREVRIYLTDGSLAPPGEALARPLEAAASNWHALAQFAGRFAEDQVALLLDIGSTTTDLIPLSHGCPAASGRLDPQRLLWGELVYTGVQRTPIFALIQRARWNGQACRVARELFATTWDAYLILGELPEEPRNLHTADGRPATQVAAWDRLARMVCADRTLFSLEDAEALASRVRAAQLDELCGAWRQIWGSRGTRPTSVVLSGAGEFLGRRLLTRLGWEGRIVSLAELTGPEVSRCAPAHALAVLATEAS